MARFESQELIKGNASLPFWKQKDVIKPGLYLVLKIFKPSMYPSGTLVCSDFRVTYPLAEWEKMRQAMADAYRNGEAMHFEVRNKKVSLITPSEEFLCTWEAQEWGARVTYEDNAELYKAFEPVVESEKSLDNVPF